MPSSAGKPCSAPRRETRIEPKLTLLKPNVLIFDEPSNHLDLESINALNIALQRYQGTVFLVAHDEDLIDEVATRIYCARCSKWADPTEWGWQDEQNGGEYAFHEPCGDHGPGLLGPSWLAYRGRPS